MSLLYRDYRVGAMTLPNPIVVASCPATEDCDRLLRCADAGAGAAILKSCHTIENSPNDNGCRRFQVSDRGLWGTSTMARELLHPDSTCVILDEVKKRSDFNVIPSVAGFSLEPSIWLDTLHLLKQHNPKYVQLDLFYVEEDLSLPIVQDRLRKLVLKLRQECSLNLLPKLNQELRPGAALEVFKNTGIAGWNLLDSIRTHLPMDLLSRKPDFPIFQFAMGLDSASLFGPWQLPFICEYVFRLRNESSIPILAGGGINNATDVARLLSLGANAVQVATAILREGPGWIKRTLLELESLMIKEQVSSIVSQPSFTNAQVRIDESLCSSCGCCAEQLMCNSIEMTSGVPQVNFDWCDGCGFCVSLCPAEAISLSVVPEQKTATPFEEEATCSEK